jgi:hypothetical protein
MTSNDIRRLSHTITANSTNSLLQYLIMGFLSFGKALNQELNSNGLDSTIVEATGLSQKMNIKTSSGMMTISIGFEPRTNKVTISIRDAERHEISKVSSSNFVTKSIEAVAGEIQSVLDDHLESQEIL